MSDPAKEERCTCPTVIFFYPYRLCAYCLKKYGIEPRGDDGRTPGA